MIKERQSREIVLYHGSLEELNSRDSNSKFKFAKERFLLYDDWSWKRDLEVLKKVLAEKEYDGLVNMRTSVRTVFGFLPIPFYEGTPIVRV